MSSFIALGKSISAHLFLHLIRTCGVFEIWSTLLTVAWMCRDSNSYILPLLLLPFHGLRHKGPIPKKPSWMHNFVSARVTARANMCLSGYLLLYLSRFVWKFIAGSLQLLVASGLDISVLRIGQVTGARQSGAWSVMDMMPIVLKSSLTLEVLPSGTGVIGFVWIWHLYYIINIL